MDFDLGDYTVDGSAAGGSAELLTKAVDAGVKVAPNLIPEGITNAPAPSLPKNTI